VVGAIACDDGTAAMSLDTVHFWPGILAGEPFSPRRAAHGEMNMSAQPAKLQAAENDLKRLMADVTRAMEKAQEAVARMAAKAAAPTTAPESAASSCASSEAAPSG
jgi:hypothetical protein